MIGSISTNLQMNYDYERKYLIAKQDTISERYDKI